MRTAIFGDLLYANGGALIERTGAKKACIFDILSLSEFTLHKYAYEGDVHAGWVNRLDIKASRARNLMPHVKIFENPRIRLA